MACSEQSSRSSTGRRALLVGLFVGPVLVLGASSWSANATLLYLGTLPAVVGLMVGTREAVAASLLTPTCMLLALPLRDDPLLGALFMATVGAAVGISAVRGWHGVASFGAPLAALALIGASTVTLPSGEVAAQSSAAAAFVLAGWVAAGGLWATFIGRLLAADMHLTGPPAIPLRTAGYFSAALALLAGVGSYIAMRWLSTPSAWWILLTVFVVVQPYYADSIRRTGARVAGTFLGAVVAAAAAEAIGDEQLVLTAGSLVISGAALWAYLRRPYWMFCLLLTSAVILKTSGGTEAILDADLARAAFTLAGAAASIVVLTIGHQLIRKGDAPRPTP